MNAGSRVVAGPRLVAAVVLLLVSLAVLNSTQRADGAFLEDVLPLTVSSITPSRTSVILDGTTGTTEPVLLSGRDALTVVFSRPVIALGSDLSAPVVNPPFELTGDAAAVPGHFYWVTTFIARFDPALDWPTDLKFDLVVDAALMAVDGARLEGELTSQAYATPSLTGAIAAVSSSSAANLTGGLWNAFAAPAIIDQATGLQAPEVPPDGALTIAFGAPVEAAFIASVVVIEAVGVIGIDGSLSDLGPDAAASPATISNVTAGPCPLLTRLEARQTAFAVCVAVANLRASTLYRLTIPAGTAYHPLAGILATAIEAPVTGLMPFRFAMVQEQLPSDSPSWNEFRPYYRRHDLWLRHGLGEGVEVDDLAALISISPPVAFELELHDPATIRLTAAFEAATYYEVSVENSTSSVRPVVDGYGQPLVASFAAFRTGDLPSTTLAATPPSFSSALSFSSLPEEWVYVTRGIPPTPRYDDTTPATARTYTVTADNADAMVEAMVGGRSLPAGATPYETKSLPVDAGPISVTSFDTAGAGGDSSFFLSMIETGYWSDQYSYSALFVGVGRLRAAFVVSSDDNVSGDDNGSGRRLSAFVTRIETALPVEGATVVVYERTWSGSSYGVSRVGAATTDRNGIAILADLVTEVWNPSLSSMVIGPDGSMAYHPTLQVSGSSDPLESVWHAALVTDRSVFKLGEYMQIKGYVRSRSHTTYSIGLTTAAIEITWARGRDPELYQVVVDQTYGTLEAIIYIRDDTQLGPLTLSLTDGEGAYLTTVEVVIADPRPPTVVISDLVVPSVFEYIPVPAGGLGSAPAPNNVTLTAETYAGTVVGGAEITIRWWVRDGFRPREVYTGGVAADYAIGLGGLLLVDDDSDAVDLPPNSSYNSNVSGVEVTAPTEGQFEVVTDADGTVSVSLTQHVIADAGAKPLQGDNLEVEVEWVGPTREVVTLRYTIPVGPSDREIVILPSAREPLPTTTFHVCVDVKAAGSEETIDGVAVAVALYAASDVRLSDDGINIEIDESAVPIAPPCELTTSPTVRQIWSCPATLPSVGRFVVVATAVDGSAPPTALLMGKTSAEWLASPLSANPGLVLGWAAPSYSPGDNATLLLNTAAPAGSSVALWWGSSIAKRTMVLTNLPAAPPASVTTIEVPIGDECSIGCSLVAALVRPTSSATLVPRSDGSEGRALLLVGAGGSVTEIPVSHLYDPSDADTRTKKITVPIELPNASPVLEVSIDAPEFAGPQSTTPVTIEVLDDAGAPMANAEVSLFVVDQAYLDLVPHEPVSVSHQMSFSLATAWAVCSTMGTHVVRGGYEATLASLFRRADLDPWLPMSWAMDSDGAWGGATPVDMDDRDFADQYSSRMTHFPPVGVFDPDFYQWGGGGFVGGGAGGYFYPFPDTGPELTNDNGNGGGGANEAATNPVTMPTVRPEFMITPLVAKAVTDGEGRVVVDVAWPSNVGTFNLRAYAIAPSAGEAVMSIVSAGVGEATTVVRNPISLTASQPRIVRTGDVFEAGATITMADPTFEGPVVVQIEVEGELILDGDESIIVEVSGTAPAEAVFSLRARAVQASTGAYTITAWTLEGHRDSFRAPDLPVLAQQDADHLVTSMVLSGDEGQIDGGAYAPVFWKEDLHLPLAVPNSGVVNTRAAIGSFAGVEIYSRSIVDELIDRSSRYANHRLALLTTCATSIGYGRVVPDEYTLWFTRSVRALERQTTPDNGLRWSLIYDPYPWNDIDGLLQAQGLIVVDQVMPLLELDVGHALAPDLAGFEAVSRLGVLREQWAVALRIEIGRQADFAREHGGQFEDWELLARVWFLLDPTWTDGLEHADDLSLETLRAHVDAPGCTHVCKAYVGLHAVRTAEESLTSRALADSVVSYFLSMVRSFGQSAYVARGPGLPDPAPEEAQAAVLRLFDEYGLEPDSAGFQAARKVAAHVVGSEVAWGLGVLDRALAALTLTAHDIDRYGTGGSADIDVELMVTSQPVEVMRVQWDSVTTGSGLDERGLATEVTSFEDLHDPPAPLRAAVMGAGEVTISIGLDFVPAETYRFPIYRGIYVEKVIRAMDGLTHTAVGPPLSALTLGHSYVVSIQITLSDTVNAVCVIENLLGGLQPVDVVVDDNALAFAGSPSYAPGSWEWWWWWQRPVWFRETRTPNIEWCSSTGQLVQPGTYSFEYEGVAVTRGDFIFPPAHAFVSLDHSIMGLSGSFRLPIADADVALVADNNTGDCPRGPSGVNDSLRRVCSNQGACNARSGVCVCDDGWEGEDCSSQVLRGELVPGAACDASLAPVDGVVPNAAVAAVVCATGICSRGHCCDEFCLDDASAPFTARLGMKFNEFDEEAFLAGLSLLTGVPAYYFEVESVEIAPEVEDADDGHDEDGGLFDADDDQEDGGNESNSDQGNEGFVYDGAVDGSNGGNGHRGRTRHHGAPPPPRDLIVVFRIQDSVFESGESVASRLLASVESGSERIDRYGLHMMQGDLAGDGREPSVNPNYLVANEDSGGSDSMSWLESTLGAFVITVGGTMVLGLLLMCCLWVLARRQQAKRAAAREGGDEGSLEVTLKQYGLSGILPVSSSASAPSPRASLDRLPLPAPVAAFNGSEMSSGFHTHESAWDSSLSLPVSSSQDEMEWRVSSNGVPGTACTTSSYERGSGDVDAESSSLVEWLSDSV